MHRWSQLFIPTLREAPADAEVASHKILLRAGYIRQLGAGIYSYLPLGQRALNKIIAIIREEMNRIGQEFLLPALNPAELWEESGRLTGMGQNMFRLKDRRGAELVLAMTHEEVMTSIARNELRSYKQLPQIWYQIQTKFRDEPRPKAGLLRVRQFTMKDSYSFDIDQAGLDLSYQKHYDAYCRIFDRCGLEYVAVEADSGAMGGSGSQEFMVYTEAGEDLIASSASGYAANLEKATSTLPPVADLAATSEAPELIHTPDARTIDEVLQYLNSSGAPFMAESHPDMSGSAIESRGQATVDHHHQIKTLAYMVEHPDTGSKEQTKHIATVGKTRPVVAFVRGDHQLNETKLSAIALGELRPMTPEEIEETFHAPAGYLGPIGLPAAPHPRKPGILIVLDSALEGRTNLIAGANQAEHHLRNVTPGRDFKPTLIADIRNINEGEPDPLGGLPLRLGKAVEIGHVFKLGDKYTKAMGASVLNADGKEVTPIMGCYGIGVERILTAAMESSAAHFAELSSFDVPGSPASVPGSPGWQAGGSASKPVTTVGAPLMSRPHRDMGGSTSKADLTPEPTYALPAAIAPFAVVVTVTNVREAALLAAGERVAAACDAAGLDTLLDDRDERAGVKFKDAELIGIPYRINIGKKLADGLVELVDRLTQTTIDLPIDTVAQHLSFLIAPSAAKAATELSPERHG